jgi:hypothetical protein
MARRAGRTISQNYPGCSGRDQFQLSGGWDLRHPRPYDTMTAVTTNHNLTTERTYLTAPAQLTAT